MRFKQLPAFWLMVLFFLLYFISGIVSSDVMLGLKKTKTKLPFLLLPLAFCFSYHWIKKKFHHIHLVFYSLVVLSALGVLLNYALDYHVINAQYGLGKVMPTPINHIRYSLLMAYAIVVGICLYQQFIGYFGKIIWGISLAFLFSCIHFLGVRSGLLALYLCLFYLIIYYIFRYRKYWKGIGALVSITLLVFVLYKCSLPLQNKINYTLYTFNTIIANGEIGNYSDSHRLISMQEGINIGLENWITGVGIADVRQEIQAIYEQKYPDIALKISPHNQYIFVFAGTGIFGLLLLLLLSFYPLFFQANFKYPLMVCFHLLILSSFLSEHTLERQIGTSFYCFFLGILIVYLHKANSSTHAVKK